MQHHDDLEVIERPTLRSDEVIVISDDEDVELRLPMARRRTRPLSTDSGSDSSAIFDENHRPRRHVSKRLKAEDGYPVPERTRKAPLTGHEDGYTRANLSFTPNGSRANLLFRTGHQVRATLPDRSFVQGAIHDPFEQNAPPPPAMSLCPWYYDQKLDVKMYRGPGYERFPVVLGTVKGHKMICDKWEADRNEQHEEDQLYIASLSGGVDPFTLSRNRNTAKMERECLREVQDVFPHIEKKFVLDKYRAVFAMNDGDSAPSAMEIISEIAELNAYPREEPMELPDEDVVLPEDGTGFTIVYDKNLPKDETYRKEALRILAEEFKHVPTITINRILQEKQSLFDTFVYLNLCEARYFDLPRDQRPYTRSKQPRVLLEKKYQRGFCESPDSHLYVNLVNELQAAKQQDARELYRLKKTQDYEAAEAQNLLQHKLDGSLVECQTCFDDEIPMNRAIMCEGDVGHFFCFDCVARLAECQIGAMKHEMICMDGSGCKAILSVEGVGRAVPTKVVDKLAFYQQQAEISAAGIEGLEQCPHCEYKAICDPIEEDSVFMCQNPDCGKNTCRRCNEATHLPKTCEESKKDKGLSARHLVEEARSEAMMRKCPKCKAKIIKELGCNKMVCSCGNMMCYVCQQDISGQTKDAGYQHFHKAGSKCPLYDAQGTERHDLDADAAEKEAIKKVKAQAGNEDLEDKDLQIETGKAGKKKKAKNLAPAGNPAVYLAEMPMLAQLAPGLRTFTPAPPAPNANANANANQQHNHAVRDAMRAQQHAMLEQQMQELRARGDALRREREVLEAQRMDHMHQASQNAQNDARAAQEAARAAQEGVNNMMGGIYGGLNGVANGFGLFNPNPQVPLIQYGMPMMPMMPQMPQMPHFPVPEEEDLEDVELLMGFGQRPRIPPGPGHGRRQKADNRGRERERDTAAQEEIDNLDFADYVLRGHGNRR